MMNRIPFQRLLSAIAAAVAILWFAVCAHAQPDGYRSEGAVQAAKAIEAGNIPGEQLLVVIAEGEEKKERRTWDVGRWTREAKSREVEGDSPLPLQPTSLARLYTMERGPGGWVAKSGPVAAMIGRNGFSKAGMKREGDGHTPTGLFPLEFVFGYAPNILTKMPYRQATEDDLWVDDPESPFYNTWMKREEIAANTSAEVMRLPDHRYRHGIVIDYNRHPVVKGRGSAIFVHAWLQGGETTAGCVAMDERELVKIIGWLDPARQPMILMGNRPELAAMPGLASLAAADRPARMDDMERQVRARLSGAKERLVEFRSPAGFFGMATAVPKDIEEEMRLRKTWHEGCPVPISDLSYLVLSHWGFDAKPHIGELVVHTQVALETVRAFAELYAARFPIERMERIDRYGADDDRSMEANNTSAFNCREKTGRPGEFSNHGYGTAIDVNPVQNPYLVPRSDALKALGWDGIEDKAEFLGKLGYPQEATVDGYCREDPAKCLILPPAGISSLDRTKSTLGAIGPGPALKAFTSWGFEWGGLWRDRVDYQHIQVDPASLK